MLSAFLTTLMQMIRIMLFLVVGFGLNRLRILPKGAGAGISRLVTTVLLPAMLIHSNMTEFNLADVGAYVELVLLGCLLWTVVTIPCLFIAKGLSGGDYLERGVYLYGLSFPNSSAVGTPLTLAILGTAGLFQFNLFLLFFVITTYSWGVNLFFESDRKNPIKRFLLHMINPVFIAMVIGLALGALNAKSWMPQMLVGFIGDIGACFVPISLIMVGYSIADYPLGDVFKRPKSYIFTALRLVIIPVTVLLIVKLMGVTKETAAIVTFAFAGPSGMNVVVFPSAYGKDCKTGASIVLLSSIGALITVPLLYALVQIMF